MGCSYHSGNVKVREQLMEVGSLFLHRKTGEVEQAGWLIMSHLASLASKLFFYCCRLEINYNFEYGLI